MRAKRLPLSLKTLAEDAEDYFAKRNLPRAAWDLPCAGCANSVAAAPYPGCPSGERACLICVRHPDQEGRQQALLNITKAVLDKSVASRNFKQWALKYANDPIDNYKTVDVLDIHRRDYERSERRFDALVNVVRAAARNDPKKLLATPDDLPVASSEE